MFQSSATADTTFYNRLQGKPFEAEIHCEFPTSLFDVIKHAKSIRYGNKRDKVNGEAWIKLLKDHINKLVKRKKLLLEIRIVLDERGLTIKDAIETIKGGNDEVKHLGIELIDLAQLCKYVDIKIKNPEKTLIPVMDSFDKNMFGEVSATAFI